MWILSISFWLPISFSHFCWGSKCGFTKSCSSFEFCQCFGCLYSSLLLVCQALSLMLLRASVGDCGFVKMVWRFTSRFCLGDTYCRSYTEMSSVNYFSFYLLPSDLLFGFFSFFSSTCSLCGPAMESNTLRAGRGYPLASTHHRYIFIGLDIMDFRFLHSGIRSQCRHPCNK